MRMGRELSEIKKEQFNDELKLLNLVSSNIASLGFFFFSYKIHTYLELYFLLHGPFCHYSWLSLIIQCGMT